MDENEPGVEASMYTARGSHFYLYSGITRQTTLIELRHLLDLVEWSGLSEHGLEDLSLSTIIECSAQSKSIVYKT